MLAAAAMLVSGAALTGQVPYQRLVDAAKEPGAWLTYSGGYSGQRHSTLDQITTANVAGLRPTWVYQVAGQGQMETSAIVADGMMYVTEPPTTVTALDPRNGRPIWSYVRPMPSDLRLIGFPATNRGVAILDDMVYVGSLDGALIALDAQTGAVRWETKVADNGTGHSITMAPLAVRGKVIVGISGGEAGIRGFIDAYDARTGKLAWRTHTVPVKGEPGVDTWAGESWKTGAGATWLTGSFDPELNLLYWGTGNPGPDWNGDVRLGDNLYTSSVLALDADTGTMKWHFQYTPHDVHDWDANQIQVLADLEINGRARKALVTANRNGFYYVLDRVTGEFLHAAPVREADVGQGDRCQGTPHRAAQHGADARGQPRVSKPAGLHELAEPVVQSADRAVLRAGPRDGVVLLQDRRGVRGGTAVHRRWRAPAGRRGVGRGAGARCQDRREDLGLPPAVAVVVGRAVDGGGTRVLGIERRQLLRPRCEGRDAALAVPGRRDGALEPDHVSRRRPAARVGRGGARGVHVRVARDAGADPHDARSGSRCAVVAARLAHRRASRSQPPLAANRSRPHRRSRRAPSSSRRRRAPGRRCRCSTASTASALDSSAGTTPPRNPSDNSLAVGPDHVFQIVNSQLAVFTKKGARFDTTGRPLLGPVATHTLFAGHGEVCGSRTNGDAVVRYDQLAQRWLVVDADLPPRGDSRRQTPAPPGPSHDRARPRAADRRPILVRPHGRSPPPPAPAPARPPLPPADAVVRHVLRDQRGTGSARRVLSLRVRAAAVSRLSASRGLARRLLRARPAPATTSIQKHACVADRAKMLKGVPATEQCLIIDGVNFLNNADLDGTALPAAGAPNIMMADRRHAARQATSTTTASTRGSSTSTGRTRRRRR